MILDIELLGRNKSLFHEDIKQNEDQLNETVKASTFLVIGAAGTIGQAVTKEIFKRNPKKLHAVDISENNLVELVRDIRSSFGYIEGEFKTLPIDVGSQQFLKFYNSQKSYDYILNLSALKHVRSEKDPYTLMRLIDTNIINVEKMLSTLDNKKTKKYFAVSSDKAANPANMMGASKRIMELFIMKHSQRVPISMARFANVLFSDGSLLHGFNQRLAKHQPISAPADVKRYFITPEESGQLCLMSCLLGYNKDIFFSKLSAENDLITFSELARRFLNNKGFEPYECESENEARSRAENLIKNNKWPCYFFKSDTTGEKGFEEFYTEKEITNLETNRFKEVGVINATHQHDTTQLNHFLHEIESVKANPTWEKKDLVTIFKSLLPEFLHEEKGKSLDEKM